MESITWVLMSITILFLILLLIKSIIKREFCVLCVSVALSWITLLMLYHNNLFANKTIIAILMGMTALGIYYFLEKKIKRELTIFRLPFLLTLVFIIYTALESFSLNSLIFLVVLWVVFILIYLFRHNTGFNKFTNKLIECCKKW